MAEIYRIFELAKVCNNEEEFAEFENEISKIKDINEFYDGMTLLMYICKYNYTKFAPKMVELLINLGANVNLTNRSERNCLMFALKNDKNKNVVEITELLIGAKINVNLQDKNGDTALMFATDYYKTDKIYLYKAIKKLLVVGANPNIIDRYEHAIIYYYNCEKMLKLLAKFGADLDYCNNRIVAENVMILIKDEKIAKLEGENAKLKNKIAELEEKNDELLSIIDYIPSGNGYENCAENYNKNLNLQHYEIANE